jgi:hypothetical protein
MFTPELIELALQIQGETVTPGDPNEKLGWTDAGLPGITTTTDALHYAVYFENDPKIASAPAQEVVLEDALDPNLDWSTFRLDEIAWGDFTVPIPADAGSLQTRVTVQDYRATMDRTWWVDISAQVDGSGTARWTFRTLDPLTGDLPEDALAGFLPVNNETGRGQGHVAFTIRPRSGTLPGTRLANRAIIRFDQEAAIQTGEVLFTVQTVLPPWITEVSLANETLRLTASGLTAGVQVFVDRTQDFSSWQTVITETPTGPSLVISVPLEPGRSEAFYRLRQGTAP